MDQVENEIVRPAVQYEYIAAGMNDLLIKLQHRLSTKGQGSFASRHEILGILEEEMDEVHDAVRSDGFEGYANFQEELLDVAVASIFGYICMKGEYIHP